MRLHSRPHLAVLLLTAALGACGDAGADPADPASDESDVVETVSLRYSFAPAEVKTSSSGASVLGIEARLDADDFAKTAGMEALYSAAYGTGEAPTGATYSVELVTPSGSCSRHPQFSLSKHSANVLIIGGASSSDVACLGLLRTIASDGATWTITTRRRAYEIRLAPQE
jgi:hypothetical protein